MSKERLDEIVDDLLNNRLELTSFVSENLEQVERVQRLEKEWLSIMKKLDNRELTIKTYYNEINRLHEQNKRYREVIKGVLNIIENESNYNQVLYDVESMLNKALEESK